MSCKIEIDDIFDHLLCDSKVQKMREYDMFVFSRHYYDRKNQGAVELNDDSMITIDVEDGKSLSLDTRTASPGSTLNLKEWTKLASTSNTIWSSMSFRMEKRYDS